MIRMKRRAKKRPRTRPIMRPVFEEEEEREVINREEAEKIRERENKEYL